MVKDVKPYKQKGLISNVSCMLMALSYYKKCNANWFNERRYFNSYKSYYYEGVPFSAIAWHLAKSELNVEIVHSEKKYIKKENGMSDKEYKKLLDEYKMFLIGAKKKGAKITISTDINSEYIRSKLDEDYIIILPGKTKDYLHSILICGYNDLNSFVICDPLYKIRRTKSNEEIDDFINNEFGKSCILIKEIK